MFMNILKVDVGDHCNATWCMSFSNQNLIKKVYSVTLGHPDMSVGQPLVMMHNK